MDGRCQAARAAVSEALRRHNINSIDTSRLRCTAKSLIEREGADLPLTTAILDAVFPKANTQTLYAHYTTFTALQAILKSQCLHLYSLGKRINEHEYSQFWIDHGYTPPMDFCGDLFYSSFCDPAGPNQDAMWRTFGDGGLGVRLTLRANPLQPQTEFRVIRYSNASRTLIADLRKSVLDRSGLEIILPGLVRLAAFYLPQGYFVENESRLLIKRHAWFEAGPSPWAPISADGSHEYFPFKLNQDTQFGRLELVAIEPGQFCDQSKLTAEIKSHPPFAHLA